MLHIFTDLCRPTATIFGQGHDIAVGPMFAGSRMGRGNTSLSQYIALQVYRFCRSEIFTQSCSTYQNICTPAGLALTLTDLYITEPCSCPPLPTETGTAKWNDHTSQTNQALGVKRALARLRLPNVSTP